MHRLSCLRMFAGGWGGVDVRPHKDFREVCCSEDDGRYGYVRMLCVRFLSAKRRDVRIK